jgi:hypothetical protein
VRIAQVDYYFTDFKNFSSDHQNKLRMGAGMVFRW